MLVKEFAAIEAKVKQEERQQRAWWSFKRAERDRRRRRRELVKVGALGVLGMALAFTLGCLM